MAAGTGLRAQGKAMRLKVEGKRIKEGGSRRRLSYGAASKAKGKHLRRLGGWDAGSWKGEMTVGAAESVNYFTSQADMLKLQTDS